VERWKRGTESIAIRRRRIESRKSCGPFRIRIRSAGSVTRLGPRRFRFGVK
jgi:hypothetical protein